MTSWTKRIGRVSTVIRDVLSNTLVPDKIYLNLSREEFQEIQLPKELVNFIQINSGKVELNWVDGPNSKPFKKVFPILKYLDEDDLVIIVDDDCIIQNDLISVRVSEFDQNMGKYAITGSNPFTIPLVDFSTYRTICPTSIFSKRMLKGWEQLIDEKIVKSYHDDCMYSMLCLLNGYPIIQSSAILVKRDGTMDVTGMHANGVCLSDSQTIDIIKNSYNRMVGDKNGFYNKMFNIVLFDSYDHAGDNAEYFYRWMMENHPEVRMTFLLSNRSSDWERLQKDGFNLYPFQMSYNVRVLIELSSYVMFSGDVPQLKGVLSRCRKKSVFLQCGTLSTMSDCSFYFRDTLNQTSRWICCCSEWESDLARMYSSDSLTPIPSGMPRRLYMKQKSLCESRDGKQIFIFPHWRRQSSVIGSMDDFLRSEFLFGMNELLNSPQLKQMRNEGIRIKFAVHCRIQKFSTAFKIPSYIEFCETGQISNLIVESDLLITDFSSISFDMAFLGRPTVCWIPDPGQVALGESDYYIQNIQGYPNIYFCNDLDEVYQTSTSLLKQGSFDYSNMLPTSGKFGSESSLYEFLVDNRKYLSM